MTTQIQFVLPADVGAEEALRRTDNAVFGLGTTKLKPFRKQSRDKASDSLEIHRWRQEGEPPTAIDLTVDRSIPAAFVSVLSQDAGHGPGVADALNEFLRAPPAGEFIAEALRRPTESAALLRAAMAAGRERDERLASLVESGLRADDRDRRAAAIKAAALLTWPSFAPALAEASARETDPELKRFLVIARKKIAP